MNEQNDLILKYFKDSFNFSLYFDKKLYKPYIVCVNEKFNREYALIKSITYIEKLEKEMKDKKRKINNFIDEFAQRVIHTIKASIYKEDAEFIYLKPFSLLVSFTINYNDNSFNEFEIKREKNIIGKPEEEKIENKQKKQKSIKRKKNYLEKMEKDLSKMKIYILDEYDKWSDIILNKTKKGIIIKTPISFED